ncbi:MAG: class I SAM-dependent methyltransferase [Acidimicrobiia bacterium]
MTERPVTRWCAQARPEAGEYDAQWSEIAAAGGDPHGEAALVMRYRPASVLDAGCGTGRVAIELARRGVDVVGVDLDEAFLAAAREKAPELTWVHADLATVALGRTFDVVVLAGNVMIFVATGSETAVLANLRGHLAPGGHVIAGFQVAAGRLPLDRFDACAAEGGLSVIARSATWDGAPYEGADYAVSVLTAST